MTTIRIPHNYEPRDYQLPLLRAMDSGYKRAIVVAHRRSGKDKTILNLTIKKMLERVGSYYYIFPTYSQSRKVIWEGIDRDGFKFLDHFPQEIVKSKNDTELKIELKNGSLFRLVGSDNIDSIVGTNPIGCVFSEYSLQDPAAWDYMRPILAENGGWAIFCFTPRGENHGYQLLEMARKDNSWFVQVLTVDDTKAIPKDILEQERREIIAKDGTDALFQQEYYVSFKVPIAGAYYAAQIMVAQDTGRITSIPVEPTIRVDTYWDLGIDDSTTIWFTQSVGREIRVIDYYENNGEALSHYIKVLQDKNYIYGNHYAPHDIQVRELSTGKSRLETARSLGINFQVAPNISIEDGIDAVRNIFSKCWFDEKRCERGLNALKSYHKEYDEKNKCYRSTAKHDWCLTGDMKVRTLQGFKPIKQVTSHDYVWGYSIFEHRLIPVKVDWSGKTKTNQRIIGIKLDNGEIIKSTYNHKFMLRDENYVEAQELKVGDSLMPFYQKRKNEQYNTINLNDGSFGYEHILSYTRFNGLLKDGYIIHHKDNNKLNNNPENLEQLTVADHVSLHSRSIERLAKLRLNSNKKGSAKATEHLIRMNKMRGGDNHHTKNSNYYNLELKNKIGTKVKAYYLDSEVIKICPSCNKQFKGNWKRLYCCDYCKNDIQRRKKGISISLYRTRTHEEKCLLLNSNHKVVEIIKDLPNEDVYDLTVSATSNFVCNGVVVHNSSHGSDAFRMFAVTYRDKGFTPKQDITIPEVSRGRWR